MFGLFRRPKPEVSLRKEALKLIVIRHLGLDDTATVSISEIQCGNPSCPGEETVILVMRPGLRTTAYRVPAPLLEVEEDEVLAALAAEA